MTPAKRIEAIINELQAQLDEGMKKIEAIAEEEREHYEEESDEYSSWLAFSGTSLSDTFRAHNTLTWNLSALYGQMMYRGVNKFGAGEPPNQPEY